jgi:hypothetical protein
VGFSVTGKFNMFQALPAVTTWATMSIQPSEPSETAPKQPIPQREFFNIEYPGRMSNVDRAFENLGGVQLLQRVRSHLAKSRFSIAF